MTTTRCKMRCNQIAYALSSAPVFDEDGNPVYETIEGGARRQKYKEFLQPTVTLSAVKDDDPASENHRFWTATPTGTVSLSINNPEGAEVFEPGKFYYVDFTAAD
jgi:hypothetical protein